jgi:prevent-host-death family protein
MGWRLARERQCDADREQDFYKMYKIYILYYTGLMAASKQVRAADARRDFSSLLDEVEHHGVHVEIRRYNDPAAYLVPPAWYERAQQALATSAEPDPPPG